MKKYLLEKIKTILENEKGIEDIEVFENLLQEYVLTFWLNDDEQYLVSIEKIFVKGGKNE